MNTQPIRRPNFSKIVPENLQTLESRRSKSPRVDGPKFIYKFYKFIGFKRTNWHLAEQRNNKPTNFRASYMAFRYCPNRVSLVWFYLFSLFAQLLYTRHWRFFTGDSSVHSPVASTALRGDGARGSCRIALHGQRTHSCISADALGGGGSAML